MISERMRLINVLNNMIRRCYNVTNKYYKDYGERGIYIDDCWLLDPTAFVEWSIANGSNKDLQLDRIDNDGPYSPDNCRYVTPSENMRNRRNTVMVTAFGETKCVMDWLKDERCVVGSFVLYQRISLGWNPDIAITSPSNDFSTRNLTAFGETKPWSEWLKDSQCKVNKITLLARINRGWDHEKAITTPPNGSRKGRKAANAYVIKAWGESKTVSEWLEDERCVYKRKQGIWERINKHKWTPEKALTQPAVRGRPKLAF